MIFLQKSKHVEILGSIKLSFLFQQKTLCIPGKKKKISIIIWFDFHIHFLVFSNTSCLLLSIRSSTHPKGELEQKPKSWKCALELGEKSKSMTPGQTKILTPTAISCQEESLSRPASYLQH